MKSQQKKITIIIIIIILFGAVIASSTLIINTLIYNERNRNENTEPSKFKGSAVIYINNNWTDVKAAGICTGKGTFSEPYIIEDLVLDANDTAGIMIENSTVYFKIRNCTLYNSGGVSAWDWSWGGAIVLDNVNNSHIINNNFSSNDRGIFLDYGFNNTISGNIITSTDWWEGIWLKGGGNNIISENNLTGPSISLGHSQYNWESDNNLISGNIIIDDGIDSYGSNNIIMGNTVNNGDISIYGINNIIMGNTVDKISLGWGSNYTLSGNIMNMGGLEIDGYWSSSLEELNSYDIDTTNLVNGKPIYYYNNENNLGPNNFTNAGQIFLVNCNNSIISNLTEFSLYYSNNNNISGNTANNNNGLSISGNNNIISGNTANNNSGSGIAISGNNNTISGNTANYNEYGILVHGVYGVGGGLWPHTDSPNYNIISGNTVNYNIICAIRIDHSDNNTVSGNTLSYNAIGIYIYASYYNNISENHINFGALGIELSWSNKNRFVGNYFNFVSECGLESICQENVIEDNENCDYEGDTYCPNTTEPPSLNYFPLILIISAVIVGVSVFIIYKNRKMFRKPKEDLEFL